MGLRFSALTALFAAWWVVSALNQFHSGAWTWRLRRHVPFGLIPLWTFFAPNPARADSRLIWREEQGGNWSEWRELHFGFAPVSSRWISNPELILNKAVSDLTGSLLQVSKGQEDRSVLLSSAYVTLLSIVLGQCTGTRCSSIQFAIVRTFAGSLARQVELGFLSEIHEGPNPLPHVC